MGSGETCKAEDFICSFFHVVLQGLQMPLALAHTRDLS